MDRTEKEEYLEKLWYMKEQHQDAVEEVRIDKAGDLQADVLDQLCAEGWARLSDDKKGVTLTEKGEDDARRLIRSHRLAERLLYDVLGVSDEKMEAGSCEFEHILASEVVDSICTLLGHPRECPHGRPIPEGECCRQSVRTVESSVLPLTELNVGETARVAYVRCERDDQMHKMDGLRIRPGVSIRLHQNFPAYVIECEGGNIALEERIAANIHVWVESGQSRLSAAEANQGQGGHRRRRRRFGW